MPARVATVPHRLQRSAVDRQDQTNRNCRIRPSAARITRSTICNKTLIRANGSIKIADNLETRKKQGSYYTPQVIVRYVVDHSLRRYFYATENGQPDGTQTAAYVRTSADYTR